MSEKDRKASLRDWTMNIRMVQYSTVLGGGVGCSVGVDVYREPTHAILFFFPLLPSSSLFFTQRPIF